MNQTISWIPTGSSIIIIATVFSLVSCHNDGMNPSATETGVEDAFCKDGLVLWLDASDSATLVKDIHGAITLWKDKSGHGHDAVKGADAASHAKVVSDAMNGKPVLRFDGDTYLEVPEIRKSRGDVSIFVVTQRMPEQSSALNHQRLISSFDGVWENDYTRPCFCVGADNKGASYKAVVWDQLLDGRKIAPIAIGKSLWSRDHLYFRGDIAEILIFDRSFLAEDPIQAVLKYLSSKWNAEIAREAEGWTRVGGLGEIPARKNEVYPLSDQDNKESWQRYEPMWDEFEGGKLDPEKWWPLNPVWKGREPALFAEHNVDVRDGKLNLTMRKEDVKNAPKGYHTFTSAFVQSKTRVKYGYFEIKAKPMNSYGSSSFFFYYSDKSEWTEIDVFEIGGGAPDFERKYNMNLHVFHTPAEKRHWNKGGVWHAPWNLAADYHVYGLEWNAKELKYYVDGVLVRRTENTHWHQALTLDFDSETMPNWFGLPDPKELPSTFSIEYVRSWKRPGQEHPPLPGFSARP